MAGARSEQMTSEYQDVLYDVRDFAPVPDRRVPDVRDVALRGVATIGKTTSVS